MIIRRVGPLSCAKIFGILQALVGLMMGGIFFLISLIGTFATAADAPFGPLRAFFGVAAIFFFPVLYGCMGFLVGLVGAALYNVLADSIGGIQVDLSEVGGAHG
jgi:hypothetical protein